MSEKSITFVSLWRVVASIVFWWGCLKPASLLGFYGESAGARTQDQRLKRAMLYQLSYALKPHYQVSTFGLWILLFERGGRAVPFRGSRAESSPLSRTILSLTCRYSHSSLRLLHRNRFKCVHQACRDNAIYAKLKAVIIRHGTRNYAL